VEKKLRNTIDGYISFFPEFMCQFSISAHRIKSSTYIHSAAAGATAAGAASSGAAAAGALVRGLSGRPLVLVGQGLLLPGI
jgi:hypothetical protein